MGIQGLLPLLKPITNTVNLKTYAGKTVAVDTYSWIHKAVFGSCVEIVTSQNIEEKMKWLNYCVNYIDLLLENRVEVYLVFDGANLPMKKNTEKERAESRSLNLDRGNISLNDGKLDAARICYSRAIDVTPTMAAELIRLCSKYRPQVKCLVAPYEADAQLAFLSRSNIVDAIISEDSDLIPFGCKEVLTTNMSLFSSLNLLNFTSSLGVI